MSNWLPDQLAHMFMGHSFFADHTVCIDFPGKQFLIER
jgi:hypothetical protein